MNKFFCENYKTVLFGFVLGLVGVVGVYFSVGGLSSNTQTESSNLFGHSSFEFASTLLNAQSDTTERSTLNEIESFLIPFEQNLALFKLLDSSNLEELDLLWLDSLNLQNLEFRLRTQELLAQRLASTDPVHALQKVLILPMSQARGSMQAVFREWSLADLNSAIEYVKSMNKAFKLAALETILRTREDLPIDERKKIAHSVGWERLADAVPRVHAEVHVLHTAGKLT